VKHSSVAAGAGRECEPAASVGRLRPAPQRHRWMAREGRVHSFRHGLAVLTILAAAALVTFGGCTRAGDASVDSGAEPGRQDSSTTSTAVLAADREYSAAWLRGDWAAVSALVAPEYYGSSTDLELDFAGLKQLFPKVKASSYDKQAPHVRVLRPDLVVVSYEMTMKEISEGQDISGRYWYATTWTRTPSGWKLLMEQEIPLDAPVQPSNQRLERP
jgi:hypothetical protein